MFPTVVASQNVQYANSITALLHRKNIVIMSSNSSDIDDVTHCSPFPVHINCRGTIITVFTRSDDVAARVWYVSRHLVPYDINERSDEGSFYIIMISIKNTLLCANMVFLAYIVAKL